MSKWDLYNAARRYASGLADEVGISVDRKQFVENNARFILNDCKRNPATKQLVLDKYGKYPTQSNKSKSKKPVYDYSKNLDFDDCGHIKGHYVNGRFEPY